MPDIVPYQIVWKMNTIQHSFFELWDFFLNLYDLFFAFLQTILEKSVGTLCANNGQLSPLSPNAMLRTTNTFNSLPKCPNIDWWGKGKEEMKVISVFFHSEKVQVGLRSRKLFAHYFSEGYLVFQRLFPRL